MKVSARNLIPGTVKAVNIGMVNAEVIIDAGGVEIVSVITRNRPKTWASRPAPQSRP